MSKYLLAGLTGFFMSSAALAQTAGVPQPPSALEGFLPVIFILIAAWFLIIRPQTKKAKQHREMITALRRGDKVVTAGGILGKVERIKDGDEEVEVEIAAGVIVKVLRGTITDVPGKPEPVKAEKTVKNKNKG